MIEFVTTEWKTRKDIEKECSQQGIKFDDRKLRKEIEYNNEQFYLGKTNVLIVHSNEGYKIAGTTGEMISCAVDHNVRSKKHLHHYVQIMKRVHDIEKEVLMGGLDGRA